MFAFRPPRKGLYYISKRDSLKSICYYASRSILHTESGFFLPLIMINEICHKCTSLGIWLLGLPPCPLTKRPLKCCLLPDTVLPRRCVVNWGCVTISTQLLFMGHAVLEKGGLYFYYAPFVLRIGGDLVDLDPHQSYIMLLLLSKPF